MKKIYLLYAALLIAAGVWWWMGRAGGPEAEIRSRLTAMQQLLVKQEGESALESADRARRFADFLAEPFVLRLEPIHQEVRDLAALTRPFVGLRRQVERVDVSFNQIEIELGQSERSATSSMFVVLNATGQDPRRGRYRVDIVWRLERDWVIEDLHAVEAMRGGFL